MKNVILTGFMGTGKTTAGKLAAKKLGLRFLDEDEYIESKVGMSIPEIFRRFGEDYFRDVESQCTLELSKMRHCLVATGGGVVLRKQNLEALRSGGIIINLDASLDTILKHTQHSKGRPLLDGQSVQQIEDRLQSRKKYYADCDHMISVDGLTPEQVANRIVQICRG